ncbi:MAG: hypothetical protein JST26_19160 [Bacteroidetes bacterium]|nr:hypothetical protein [Bacteroidota bacterium]
MIKTIKTYLFFLCILLSAHLFSQSEADTANPLVNYIISLDQKVQDEHREIGTLDPDSISSLPIGIIKQLGIIKYTICVDSATWTPGVSKFSAYAAIEMPGTGKKMAFAAKNIGFNPKGVYSTNNSKLLLVSEHHIKISPKVVMVLKPDGTNYVEWDCNGFKSINLKGYFEFSNTMLIPDPDVPHPDSTVHASFEIHTNDIHNFIAQINMSPFCIKGLKDFTFSVTDATVDMSELANAPNMTYPAGYPNTNGSDPQLWTGFYLKQFKIKLPKEISKGEDRMEVSANNFLIDKLGVSGYFQVTNLFGTNEGSMSGWAFSISQLGINIVTNHLNGGSIAGSVIIPVNDNVGLDYSAAFFHNDNTNEVDYQFTLSPKENLSASVLSADLDIYPTSSISVSKQAGSKFKPTAVLNGKISFGNGNFSAKHLDFEQVTIISEAPYLTNGIFSFVNSGSGSSGTNTTTTNPSGGGDDPKAGNFSISIQNITIVISQSAPAIGVTAGLNFMSEGGNSLGVTAGVTVLTKIEPTVVDGVTRNKWKFDRVRLNDIGIDIQTQSFTLTGLIMFKDNDPVYGKGFFGSISFMMEGVLSSPASVNVWFGKVNDYRYFYVDGTIPYTVPIGYGLAIYRFMGGLYYHMKQPGNGVNLATGLYTPVFGAAQTYIPDNTVGIGFKAGITIGTLGSPKPFNGDVALEVQFNSNGGLNMIKLTGDVFFMSDITERLNKPTNEVPVHGGMVMLYDNINKSFHAVLSVDVHYAPITGGGQTVIHAEPGIWYVCVGKPSNRCYIDVAGMVHLDSYFMVGNSIEPIPPVPAEVVSLFGGNLNLPNQRDASQLQTAQGICLGASLTGGSSKEYGLSFFKVYGNFSLIVGFDAMLAHYPAQYHCQGSSGEFGFHNWYLTGQVYAGMQGAVGVKGDIEIAGISQSFDFQILSGSVAAVLYAQMPKPFYMQGAVACHYNILNTVHGSFDYDFTVGSVCNIVQN